MSDEQYHNGHESHAPVQKQRKKSLDKGSYATNSI